MGADREFACRECGKPVMWRTAKSGSRYLAQRKDWMGTDTLAQRCFWPAHACTPNSEWREQAAADEAARAEQAKAEGRIERGVDIVVAKGRKVAIGTTGRVFWVAPEEDGYGVIKVGFATEAGEKHFINIANVEVAR